RVSLSLLSPDRDEPDRRSHHPPLISAQRYCAPYLTDDLRTQAQEGRTRLLSLDTAAYSSYSSCRQYREDFAKTIETLAGEGLEVSIDKIRQFYNHPGYADACAA